LEQRVEVPLEDVAEDPLRHVLARRIGDEDGAARRPLLPLSGQQRELARLELAPVEELHGAGDEQRVTLPELPLEPRLPRPCDRQQPGIVLQHGLEDAQALPRRDHALAPHGADDRHVHADVGAPDRGHGGGVVVAPRHVVEEVPRRPDADAGELVRTLGSDALEELDRAVEPRVRLRGQPKTPSTNASTSKVSRSSRRSPVPTSFTGTPNSCWSDTTMPPRADESIFSSTMPVMPTTFRTASSGRTAFCPTVASSTISVSCGAPSSRRRTTRSIFSSSCMSPWFVCSRPAVSISSTSMPRASAAP